MNKLLSLAKTQLTAWLRTRSYSYSISAGFILVAISAVIHETGGTESFRLLTDFGLLFTSVISSIIGMGFSLSSITASDELLLIQQISVRPVERSSIILSRLVAALGVALLSVALMTLALLLVGSVAGVPHPLRIVAGGVFAAQEAALTVALTIAAGANSSRAVALPVAAASYFLFRVGVPAADFRSGQALLRYLPRFDRFSLAEWVHGGSLPDDMGFRLAYTAALLVLLTGIAVWRFSGRDLGAR